MPTVSRTTAVWRDVDTAMFRERIVPANRPAILKGLVAHWPAVRAGLEGASALTGYLRQFSSQDPVQVLTGDPSAKGRLFYTDNLERMNFSKDMKPLADILNELERESRCDRPCPIAVQALDVRRSLTGLEAHISQPLIEPSVSPRIWIGNAMAVAAHFDMSENLACVVGGRRRFTLFPPDQVSNLYIGPLETTPAGAPVSMVDFDAPDFARYPRFSEALDAAEVAELEPGDAIYIPYLWWHHVRSLERFNVLVNYWWSAAGPQMLSPQQLMLLALMTVRDLPPTYRSAWRVFFDHWVFHSEGDPTQHLPDHFRGVLGATTPGMRQNARAALIKALGGGEVSH